MAPFIFWLEPVFGVHGASYFLGVSEWLFGALLLAGFWNKTLGILGAIGSTGTFVSTVTIIPFMPNGWAAIGFPAMAINNAFLLKDVVLLAASLYLLKEDIRRSALATQPSMTRGRALSRSRILRAKDCNYMLGRILALRKSQRARSTHKSIENHSEGGLPKRNSSGRRLRCSGHRPHPVSDNRRERLTDSLRIRLKTYTKVWVFSITLDRLWRRQVESIVRLHLGAAIRRGVPPALTKEAVQ
ncbi:MAG: DUF417 family protein [Aliidongia sp.]